MATKVTLRQKAISKGRKSLYLDFYPPIQHPKTGKPTRREFLGIYIMAKPKNALHKANNKETEVLAEQIRHQRENDLNKPEVYNAFEKEQLIIREKGEKDFIVYFRQLANKRKSSNYDNWISTLHYLESFAKGSLKFGNLNVMFLNNFKEHLLTTKSRKSEKMTLDQNSASSYFNKVKAALKQAHKDGLLTNDLNSQVEAIKPVETHRQHLSREELNRLVKEDCKSPIMKRAAIFSALTGLRFSDIQKLTWKEIEHTSDYGYSVKFRQKKTGSVEVLPISEQAFKLLGTPKDNNDQVFEGLKYSAYQNKFLRQWIEKAGINKEITFHCFRHTYATLQLSAGTDIYTVSKLLGHKDLKTTQIYAKVIDESKRMAATRIILDF